MLRKPFNIALIVAFSLQLTLQPALAGRILFSEIGWAGTKASTSDEYIEIYNTTSDTISLDGWFIYERVGTLTETKVEELNGEIAPFEYYLIERTTDKTVLSIDASQPPTSWGGSGLSNSGENLSIRNNLGVDEDTLLNSGGWFAGGGENRASMQRLSFDVETMEEENWVTSQDQGDQIDSEANRIYGTPGSGFVGTIVEEQDIAGLEINEIVPNPEGSDSYEFIELKNNSSHSINLTNFVIKDSTSTTSLTAEKVGNEGIIESGEFVTIYGHQGLVSLNNAGENIQLLSNKGTLIDEISYPELNEGESYSRFEEEIKITITPTPNEENIFDSWELRKINKIDSPIRINEIVSDPLHNDSGEFVELYNSSDEEKNIEGFYFKDAISTFVVSKENNPDKVVIPPKGYVSFRKTDGMVSINNTGENISLYDDDGYLIDSVTFPLLKEGQSYSYIEEAREFRISEVVTENGENILIEPEEDLSDEDSYEKWEEGIGSIKKLKKFKKIEFNAKIVSIPSFNGRDVLILEDSDDSIPLHLTNQKSDEFFEGQDVLVEGYVSEYYKDKIIKGEARAKENDLKLDPILLGGCELINDENESRRIKFRSNVISRQNDNFIFENNGVQCKVLGVNLPPKSRIKKGTPLSAQGVILRRADNEIGKKVYKLVVTDIHNP